MSALSEQLNDCRIIHVGNASTADKAKDIPGLSAGEIKCFSPGDALALLRELRSRPAEQKLGFVIDCTAQPDLEAWFFKNPGIARLHGAQMLKSKSPAAEFDVWDLLGLASAAASEGWPSVIVLGKLLASKLSEEFNKQASFRRFAFRFVADQENPFRKAFAIVNAAQAVDATRFTVPFRDDTSNRFIAPDEMELCAQWETEEFEKDDVLQAVRHAFKDLPNPRQVFLRTICLARMLATRFFERRAVAVNVLLIDKPGYQTLKAKKGEGLERDPLFSFEPSNDDDEAFRPVWFHFGDPILSDGGIETGLSRNLLIVVDRETGQVLGVHDPDQPPSTSRYEALTKLSKDSTIAAVLPEGYLEVYHQGQLFIWYDRHKYRLQPFHSLHKAFVDGAGYDVDVVTPKMLAAIALLMDRKESSIIVLCDAADLEHVREAKIVEPMRAELSVGDTSTEHTRIRLQMTRVADMSAESLATILRMDGAHFLVDAEFRLVAQHITDPTRATVPGHGSGRTAAATIAGKIRGTTIKVSSSGEIRVLRGQYQAAK